MHLIILGDPYFDTLSAEEFGCYCLLLLNLWVNRGKLKLDYQQIQRICHLKSRQTSRKILRKLRPRFNVKSRGYLRSDYIDQQMQHQQQQRLKSIKGGRIKGQKMSANPCLNPALHTPYSKRHKINNIIIKLSGLWRWFSSKEISKEQIASLQSICPSSSAFTGIYRFREPFNTSIRLSRIKRFLRIDKYLSFGIDQWNRS